LDEWKESQQQFAFKLPSSVSKFWEEINNFVVEFETYHKESLAGAADTKADDKESFFRSNKKFWKLRKKEIQILKEELQSGKELGLFDDTKLLNLCNRIASQDRAEKKLKAIVEKANRGDISVNHFHFHRNCFEEYKKDTQSILENHKKEIEQLHEQVHQTQDQLVLKTQQLDDEKKQNKELQETFGGMVIRERAHKEKEMTEKFAYKEKQILTDCKSELMQERELKKKEIEKLEDDMDALKMKNVEWIQLQAELEEKFDKAEKEKWRAQSLNKKLLDQSNKHQMENTELQIELSLLKKNYSDLFNAHKKLTMQIHTPHDLKNLPSPLELQQKFEKFLSQKPSSNFYSN